MGGHGRFSNSSMWARFDTMPVIANLGKMHRAGPFVIQLAASILLDAAAPPALEIADAARYRPVSRANNWYY